VDVSQVISVQFDVDGRSPVRIDKPVPPCSSVVVGVHEIIAGDANFGTTVWSEMGSSATLIMRSMVTPESFWNPATTLVPPVDGVK